MVLKKASLFHIILLAALLIPQNAKPSLQNPAETIPQNKQWRKFLIVNNEVENTVQPTIPVAIEVKSEKNENAPAETEKAAQPEVPVTVEVKAVKNENESGSAVTKTPNIPAAPVVKKVTDLTNSLTVDYKIQGTLRYINGAEKTNLEKSIIVDGLRRDCITVWEKKNKDIIIDGYEIYFICKKAKIPIKKKNIIRKKFANRNEAIYWRVKHNMGRRHMKTAERCKAALALKPTFEKIGNKRMSDAAKGLPVSGKPWNTQKKLAKAFNVSGDTLYRYEQITNKADRETIKLVDEGKVSIASAYKDIVGAKGYNDKEYTELSDSDKGAYKTWKVVESVSFGSEEFATLVECVSLFKDVCDDITIKNRKVSVTNNSFTRVYWADMSGIPATSRAITFPNPKYFLQCLRELSAIKYPVKLDFMEHQGKVFMRFLDYNNDWIFGWTHSVMEASQEKHLRNPILTREHLNKFTATEPESIASGTIFETDLSMIKKGDTLHSGWLYFEMDTCHFVMKRYQINSFFIVPFSCRSNPAYSGNAINSKITFGCMPAFSKQVTFDVSQSKLKKDMVVISFMSRTNNIDFGMLAEGTLSPQNVASQDAFFHASNIKFV